MAIASGSYGYVVVKPEWILHQGIQMLLGIRREVAARARAEGFHLLEVKILDDSAGSGLLVEVEIGRPDRNGTPAKPVKAQVVIPWHHIEGVACFSDEAFGEVRKGLGFQHAKG